MTTITIKMEQENAIKKVLKNEYAQIISIVAVIWFFVTNVIIPINNIQTTQLTIQVTLSEIKTTIADFNARITANSNAILVLQSKIK